MSIYAVISYFWGVPGTPDIMFGWTTDNAYVARKIESSDYPLPPPPPTNTTYFIELDLGPNGFKTF